jgi:formylglycine-generating enzyme required for sulfatase activity
MEWFTADYLANLTAELTVKVLEAAGRRTREALTGGPEQEALRRCTLAGLAALLSNAIPEDPEAQALLEDIFRDFFADPDTSKALAVLLRGDRLEIEELQYIFEAVGYDADTLPGVPFEHGLRMFEAAFVQQVVAEPVLRETLVATQTLAQTDIQRATLNAVEGILVFLREHWKDQLGIRAGILIAHNVVSGQQFTYQMPATSLPAPLPDWERHYLEALIAYCDPLDLTPIDETCTQPGGVGQAIRINISDVFTRLYLEGVACHGEQSVADAILRSEHPERMERARETQTQPIMAVEAVGAVSRLVILGQPGGGKSALFNYLVTQLARRRLGEPAPLPGWADDEQPLPILIVLRRFADWLPEKSVGTAGDVWDYLEHQLKEIGRQEFFPALKHTVLEKGALICFDGLDEVSVVAAETRRPALLRAIVEFAGPLKQCRVILTCRPYAYEPQADQDGSWRLPEAEFPVVQLALFDLPQIEEFARTWYQKVGPQKGWTSAQCTEKAQHLYASVQALPHLRELAQYPLLLTLMAQVHAIGPLPDDRADLYDRAVKLLLANWENRIVRDVQGDCEIDSLTRLGVSLESLRVILEDLALEAHSRQERQERRGERTADIPREDLRDALQVGLGSVDRADQVIQYVENRAGLLVAQGQRMYTFPHRTFQEYLAARAALRHGDFAELLRDKVQSDLNWWREVFLLAAGSARTAPRNIVDLVDTLFLGVPDGHVVTVERAPWAVLAAQALVETRFINEVQREDPPGRYAGLYERLRKWLKAGLRAVDTLEPRQRGSIGNALAALGDPRFRAEAWHLPDEPLLGFVEIPAGEFVMGTRAEDIPALQKQYGGEKELYERETPQHRRILPTYYMARYPVTVAQFQAFVQASGYEPGDPDCLRGVDTHPVVWVSWHEAVKYCEWLTERLRAWESTPEPLANLLRERNWEIRLPSEAEWEKAARGPADGDNPDRIFSWGDGADPNRANYEMNVGSTSAVGCFPSGASPYQIEDLSGNVWEWTRTQFQHNYQNYQPELEVEDRAVLRGGAFGYGEWFVRCAFRLGRRPGSRFNHVGFRVVVGVPHTSGL